MRFSISSLRQFLLTYSDVNPEAVVALQYPLDSLLDNDVNTALSVLDSNPSYAIANIIRLENDVDEDGLTTRPDE